MNTLAAAELIAADATDDDRIVERTLRSGEADTLLLHASGEEALIATVGWNDPAGTPPDWSLDPPDLVLVNDLDLRLEEVASGTPHLPWRLDPSAPGAAATTGDNDRDNVERVDVAAPEAGVWRVIVSHEGELAGGTQDYSLVLTGLLTAPVAVADVPAAGPRLAQNRPNPFNPLTTIGYELPNAGAVRLRIYAVDGRLVRTLVDGSRKAGSHTVAWDGRDGAGRAMAAGVYLYRLETAQGVLTRRMALVR
jgi:hypothetical protein